MKEKIKQAVKTTYAKYGLKAESVTKISNIVETKLTAMGEIDADKLDGIINAEVQSIEPLIGIIQSEADARVRRIPAAAPAIDDQNQQTDLEVVLAKVLNPLQSEVTALKAKLENQDKTAARNARLSIVKEGLKAKGATKEPVLNVLLASAEFADSDSNEQVVEKLLPTYDAKMKEFYGEGFVPRLPVEGKSEIDKAMHERTQRIIDKTVSGLNVVTPEVK